MAPGEGHGGIPFYICNFFVVSFYTKHVLGASDLQQFGLDHLTTWELQA
jgi:hypothetical protein